MAKTTAATGIWWIALLLVGLELPFLSKPIHMDDELYWRQSDYILADWRNPYGPPGATGIWAGEVLDFYAYHPHPPLMPYLLAAARRLLGGDEAGPRIVFALMAGLNGLALWFVARRFTSHQAAAVLCAAGGPAALVVGSLYATEVPAALFGNAALALLLSRRAEGRGRLVAAGLLTALALATRYTAAYVLLLGCLWIALRPEGPQSRARRGLEALAYAAAALLPVALMSWLLAKRYGMWHWEAVATIFSQADVEPRVLARLTRTWTATATSLAYCGPALPLFLALALPRQAVGHTPRSRPALRPAAAVLITVAVLAGVQGARLYNVTPWTRGFALAVAFGIALATTFVVIGVSGEVGRLVTALRRGQRADGAAAALLIAWLLGLLFFNVVVMRYGSTRYALPLMFPATLILLRRFETPAPGVSRWQRVIPLMAVLTILQGLAVAWADVNLARVYPEAPARLEAATGRPMSRVHVAGQFGFRFYLARAGAHVLRRDEADVPAGDLVVFAGRQGVNNEEHLSHFAVYPRLVRREPLVFQHPWPLRTIDFTKGDANFYWYGVGLPWVVSRAPLETIQVYEVR